MANFNYQTALGQYGNAQTGQRNALAQALAGIGNIQNFGNQYLGDNAGYRNRLQQSLQSVTNQNFNNARANTRQRANMAGFGYAQPVSQAGENNVEIGRAHALSQIPLQADEAAFSRGMQAAGLQQGAVNSLHQQAAIQDPQGWYQTAMQQKQADDARKGALWQSLAQLGLGIGMAPMTGGGSLFGAMGSTMLGKR